MYVFCFQDDVSFKIIVEQMAGKLSTKLIIFFYSED